MSNEISIEEKNRIRKIRVSAVKKAWEKERERVINGKGTRKWTISEQKALIKHGAVHGYDGHHMKSAALYPEYAGNPDNIQFLTQVEHMKGAHKEDPKSMTNGYYNPETKKMEEFNGDELKKVPVIDLKKKYIESNEYRQKKDYNEERKKYEKSLEEKGNNNWKNNNSNSIRRKM